MSDVKKVLDMIKEKEVKYVDFRFTNPVGKWQHTAQYVDAVDEDTLTDGIMFDGSSIAGWKDINKSDMNLKPDLSTAVLDPFTAQPTLILFCDTIEPTTGQLYNRCPRSIARKALDYLSSTGIGDTAYFGPEAEFFIFDDVRYYTAPNNMFFAIDSEEGPYNDGRAFEEGNPGHRPRPKGGYFPVAPVDSAQDLRSEIVSVLAEMGVAMEKHHHEVAPAQHELGIKFNTLLKMGDSMQLYKYVVHMVAHSYGKTATFMPKPVFQDNGSGMHVHQSIFKGDKNVFAGSGYADLSETCLHYIGGLLNTRKPLTLLPTQPPTAINVW